MAANFDNRPGRNAGPLLASTLVLLLGSVGVAAIVAAGGGDPYIGGAAFLGIIIAVPLLLLILRATSVSSLRDRWGWMVSRHKAEADDYLPRALRTRRRYGTNAPPSVENVREAKEGLNTWVPASGKRRPQARNED